MTRSLAPTFNVALRTATLGTRFVLVFILAKYLDAASLGYYGLFTAAIGYALLCVGLDLYVYTTREITKVEPARQGLLLKSQAALVGLLYVPLAPLALLLLSFSGLPDHLIWWFLPILVLEHLNQELFRLLVIMSRQITASVLLFIRQGSWALAVAGLMAVSENGRNLDMVMVLWSCAGAAAAGAGIWTVRGMKLGGWRERVDWAWLRKGIAVSTTLLIATLALRGIQTVDRYWLESLAGIEIVGAYVLFYGVASALNVFLDAAIFSFKYPELVKLGHSKEYARMRSIVQQMTWQAAAASLAFVLVSSLLLPLLLAWVGQDIYQSEISLYYWVLGGVIAFSLSMIPHYALYALGRDRVLVASHLTGLAVFAVATLGLAQISRTHAVPIAVLVSMIVVLSWKTAAYLKVFHRSAHRADARNSENGLI